MILDFTIYLGSHPREIVLDALKKGWCSKPPAIAPAIKNFTRERRKLMGLTVRGTPRKPRKLAELSQFDSTTPEYHAAWLRLKRAEKKRA